jgi:hypothetical protein
MLPEPSKTAAALGLLEGGKSGMAERIAPSLRATRATFTQ